MLDDGGTLVGFVTDTRVVRERDPAAPGHLPQPNYVLAVVLEVVPVSLYREASVAQNGGKLKAEIAVGEEDNFQATRSYTTACSISAGLSS